MHSKTQLLLLAVTFLSASTSAQFYDNYTIGSCVDVDCPGEDDGTITVKCQVANRTLRSIGLRTFDSAITQDSQQLTWTVGMHNYDGINASSLGVDPKDYDGFTSLRVVEKNYYLGTPPDLNLTSTQLPYEGCAIMFRGNKLDGPQQGGPSCGELMGDSCLPSLVTQAKDLLSSNMARNGSETTEQACQRLQRSLNETTFPSGCSQLAGKNSWNDMAAVRKYLISPTTVHTIY